VCSQAQFLSISKVCRIRKWGWQFFPDFFCKFPAVFVNLLLGVLAAFRDSFVVGQADFGKISKN
jgi:hypothetical protein